MKLYIIIINNNNNNNLTAAGRRRKTASPAGGTAAQSALVMTGAGQRVRLTSSGLIRAVRVRTCVTKLQNWFVTSFLQQLP